MNARSGELFIGVTVTVATLIVILGILFLGGYGLLTRGTVIDVRADNAAGAGAGDEVLFRGVATGSVREVRFTEQGVVLRLRLEGSPPIPRDSRFVIRSTGVLGGRVIEIRPGTESASLKSGAEVTAQVEPDLLDVAGQGVEAVGEQLQRTLSSLDAILRDLQEGRGSVGRAMKDEQLYDNVNKTVRQLNDLLADIRKNPKKYFSISVF